MNIVNTDTAILGAAALSPLSILLSVLAIRWKWRLRTFETLKKRRWERRPGTSAKAGWLILRLSGKR